MLSSRDNFHNFSFFFLFIFLFPFVSTLPLPLACMYTLTHTHQSNRSQTNCVPKNEWTNNNVILYTRKSFRKQPLLVLISSTHIYMQIQHIYLFIYFPTVFESLEAACYLRSLRIDAYIWAKNKNTSLFTILLEDRKKKKIKHNRITKIEEKKNVQPREREPK